MKYNWSKVDFLIQSLWEQGKSPKAISRFLEENGHGVYPPANVNSFVGKFRKGDSAERRSRVLNGAKRAVQNFNEIIECPLCRASFNKTAWNSRFCEDCRKKFSARELNRFKLYGLKPEQFTEMLDEQSGRCFLCQEVFVLDNDRAGPANPCVDHCHKTGRIRGLLCMKCNWALERVEQEGWMDRARNYLE